MYSIVQSIASKQRRLTGTSAMKEPSSFLHVVVGQSTEPSVARVQSADNLQKEESTRRMVTTREKEGQ